jgi:hypothetical protein
VTVAVEISPHDLNLKSKEKFVEVKIKVTPPLSARDINLSTLLVNGIAPSTRYTPKIEDGGKKLKFKLDRSAFNATLTAGRNVLVVTEGEIGNSCFLAENFIKVKAPKIRTPEANALFHPGDIAAVSWDTPEDTPAPTVSVLTSMDGGATWNIEANNIPNTGSYSWQVPNTPSNAVRVAIATVEITDETGPVTGVELAESEYFTIDTATGVDGNADMAFALHGVSPVPARGAFAVSFSLPNAGRATLAVYDVSGRQVLAREVGSLGAGRHSLTLGQKENLRPGLYMVRLTQAKRSQTTRALVIQ